MRARVSPLTPPGRFTHWFYGPSGSIMMKTARWSFESMRSCMDFVGICLRRTVELAQSQTRAYYDQGLCRMIGISAILLKPGMVHVWLNNRGYYAPSYAMYQKAESRKCCFEDNNDPKGYSYFQIDRPESIFFDSPLLFSCGAVQTKGSRLLRCFVGGGYPRMALDCATSQISHLTLRLTSL